MVRSSPRTSATGRITCRRCTTSGRRWCCVPVDTRAVRSRPTNHDVEQDLRVLNVAFELEPLRSRNDHEAKLVQRSAVAGDRVLAGDHFRAKEEIDVLCGSSGRQAIQRQQRSCAGGAQMLLFQVQAKAAAQQQFGVPAESGVQIQHAGDQWLHGRVPISERGPAGCVHGPAGPSRCPACPLRRRVRGMPAPEKRTKRPRHHGARRRRGSGPVSRPP